MYTNQTDSNRKLVSDWQITSEPLNPNTETRLTIGQSQLPQQSAYQWVSEAATLIFTTKGIHFYRLGNCIIAYSTLFELNDGYLFSPNRDIPRRYCPFATYSKFIGATSFSHPDLLLLNGITFQDFEVGNYDTDV